MVVLGPVVVWTWTCGGCRKPPKMRLNAGEIQSEQARATRAVHSRAAAAAADPSFSFCIKTKLPANQTNPKPASTRSTMKNSAGGAGGDERCGDDDGGGGGSASHGSITLVASQNGMTSPANQNSRQARANHHITDVGSKNNGGGGGNNAPTTGDGVPTRSKGGSVSAQPLADPSTGSTKAAAAKKRSAKTLDDEDTEDDAPTASTESSSRAKTNRNAKKGGNGGSAGATNRTSASITPSASAADRNSNKRSRSNGSGAAASAKTRSRGNGADDGAGGNAIPSAAVAASTASVIGPFAGASGDTTRGGRPRRSSTDKTLEKMAKVLKDEDAPIDDDDDVMMEECDGRGKKVRANHLLSRYCLLL